MTGLPTMAHSGTSPGINGLASTIVTPTSGTERFFFFNKQKTKDCLHHCLTSSDIRPLPTNWFQQIFIQASFTSISLHLNKLANICFCSGRCGIRTFGCDICGEGDKMDSQKGRDSCLNKLQIHLAPHCCFKGAVWMGIVKFVLSWVGKRAYFCFHLLFVFFSVEKEKICPSPYFVFCGWHIQPYNEDAGMTVFHCKIVEPTCCWHFPGVAVGTLVIQISTFKTSNGFFFPPPFRFLASQKSKSQLFEANDTGGWVPTNIERLVTSFASLFPPRS